METAFGTDFGQVRIHTGTEARASAAGLRARAFTVGQDIYLRRPADDPRVAGPTPLLAHELAHTVQQRGASAEANIRPSEGRFEREASAAAHAAARGERAVVRGRLGGLAVQRTGDDETPPVTDAELRARYIRIAEERIREIRDAVASGRVWPFENEDLLLGSELLEVGVPGLRPPPDVVTAREHFGVGPGAGSTIERRLHLLANVICNLQTLVEDLRAGGALPRSRVARSNFEVFYSGYIYERGRGTEIMDWGVAPRDRGWGREGANTGGEYPYVEFSPGPTPVLRPARLPWWTCGPTPEPSAAPPAPARPMRRRMTEFWAHVPDPARHPAVVDYLETPVPSSNLYLGPPGREGARLERRGESYPVWRDERGWFYLLGDRRIDIPNFRELPVLR